MVNTKVRAETSSYSIETVMKYGKPKAREEERAAQGLEGYGRRVDDRCDMKIHRIKNCYLYDNAIWLVNLS